jgi:hypothetical protein
MIIRGSVAGVCSGSTDPVPLGASVVRLGVLGARCRATAPQRRAREAGKESLGFVAPDEAGEVLGEGGLRQGLLGFGILYALNNKRDKSPLAASVPRFLEGSSCNVVTEYRQHDLTERPCLCNQFPGCQVSAALISGQLNLFF